jgi:hypothetical protein
MKTAPPQSVTLIAQCREVEALIGAKCEVFAGPNYGTILGGGHEVALYGPTQRNWRNRNKRIIADLKVKLAGAKQLATA